MSMCTLEDLPEDVILHIFSYLTFEDKFNASVVSNNLLETFCEPRWCQKQDITFVPDLVLFPAKSDFLCIPKNMAAKVGKLCRFLTIIITDLPAIFSGEKDKQLYPLHKMVLDAGSFSAFIENASELKSLKLKSCLSSSSMTQNEEETILYDAVIKSRELKKLNHLDLFWADEYTLNLSRKPNNSVVLELVKNLTSLQTLVAGSTMLSNDIIKELSSSQRSQKMSLLKIFVTFNDRGEIHCPTISSTIWENFSYANPNVNVECHVMASNIDATRPLTNMLTHGCPLSNLYCPPQYELDGQFIEYINTTFNINIQTFERST